MVVDWSVRWHKKESSKEAEQNRIGVEQLNLTNEMAFVKQLLSIGLDALSFILVLLPSIIVSNVAKPYQRGFFCDDNTIKYPYKSDTVTRMQYMCGSILIPTCLCLVVETVHHTVKKRSRNSSNHTTWRDSIPNLFRITFTVLATFAFGFAVSNSIAQITKVMVGRLRPHFLSICKPDLTKINCTTVEHMSMYIEEDICTRPYDGKMIEARLSFPSNHSAIVTYAAVFLALYIQHRMTWKSTRTLGHCLQVMSAFAAIFVGLSRISDNKHHWSDVLAGACLGAIIATLTGLNLMHRFKTFKRMELDLHQTLPLHNPSSPSAPTEKTSLLK